ncbi:isoleucine--tRNA ligase [Acidianus sulfidivorans JP7]|uniref:Isoleucine--tRNA ligase n=1 Tax=Acidianus sulfidivorans JP7 TaxID=619593 RepID=A0A2U9IQF1_9CREN|nr:isoleucine--tRNA ligase [Acidianus sulfidivorans]AWR98269.1 isoleucine--tRNA ligase [Acidianus sulfidivorans JP7]
MPTKFDLKTIENEIISYWNSNNIYDKLKKVNNSRSNKFLFIDGPPYPSAPIPHIGTIWNKVIKDSILRFKRIEGYRVYDQPGYDTHGLPIEVAVEKKFNINRKQEIIEKVGVDKFIQMCKDFALENANSMTKNFKNVGVFMDWDHPYYTLDNEYISNSWSLIKKAYERGLLQKDVEVLHWCPRCETTLSDYEVSEYKDLEDPSIYVKFKILGENNRYLIIWTTTPWTIPSNVFVMINSNYDYADVQVGSEVYVIAKDRVESVMKEAKIKNYKILRVYKGSELIGIRYQHPLRDIVDAQKDLDNYHKVVDAGDVVTLEEGTGLVHSAPGHGDVDFEIGKKMGFPVVMLVNDRGEFIDKSGKYSGKYVRDASKDVIEDLKARNALLFATTIVHRYPICWRCKTPLILRAIEQWFIKVTKLKTNLLNEIDKVNWIPDWGKTRIGNMVKELRDWVISRQRFWGNPLPIWVCKNGHVNVIGSLDELKENAINEVPKDLHRPWIDNVVIRCKECGEEAHRIPDVADVWFDSGVAFFASLGKNWAKTWNEIGPVDLVLEGHDQLRGWFFSLLRSGVILLDKAPYRSVLVHGFMLDEQGREMHKSLGNYVEPEVVINKYGRDVLRSWLLRNTTWEDAKFSWKAMELEQRDIHIVWNVYVFASTYMSLDNFNPEQYTMDDIKPHLRVEDQWILSRYYNMLKNIKASMANFKVHEMANYLFDFIINDISRFYLRLARKRAWIEYNDPDKIAMYYILYNILKGWIIIASSVIPYTAEKIYKEFVVNRKDSVSMEDFPEIKEEFINNELEKAIDIVREIEEAGLNARAKAGIKLRWPIKKAYVFINTSDKLKMVKQVIDVLKSVLNVKEIELNEILQYSKFTETIAIPNPGKIGKDFKQLTPKIIEYINLNQKAVAEGITSKGYYDAIIDSTSIRIDKSHVRLEETMLEGYVSSKFNDGILVISKEISQEEEEEGIVRDIIRRIQFMRKMLNLNVVDYIEINISPPEDKRSMIEKWKNYIINETRAKDLKIGEAVGSLVESWEIEDQEYNIGISKVS